MASAMADGSKRSFGDMVRDLQRLLLAAEDAACGAGAVLGAMDEECEGQASDVAGDVVEVISLLESAILATEVLARDWNGPGPQGDA